MEGMGTATVLFSTFATQWASRKFGLDWSQTGGLTMVINLVMAQIYANAGTWWSELRLLFQDSWSAAWLGVLGWVGLLGAIGGVLWWFYMPRWRRRATVDRQGYYTLNLHVKSHIDTFSEYLKTNPTMSVAPETMEFGDPRLLAQAYLQAVQSFTATTSGYGPSNFAAKSLSEIQDRASFVKPQTDVVIGFADPNFDITGTYCWRVSIEKVTLTGVSGSATEQVVRLPFIEVRIAQPSKKLKRPSDYLDEIEKWTATEKEKTKVLWMAKVIHDPSGMVCTTYKLYDGLKQSMAELERRYIDTFFQNDKHRLWNLIKTIDRDPESILTLGQFPQAGFLLHGPPGTGKSSFAYRVAMSLSRHIMSIDIRTLPNRGTLYQLMRKPYINNKQCSPKDVVFVFDEFDLTVKELARRQSINSNIMNKWMTDVTRFESKFEPLSSGTDDQRKKNLGAMKLSAAGFGGDDDVQLNDLLEIFQGVVPSHQFLAFATTNCFDELKDLCPPLFRPGRLTPVHFDHFDCRTIDQLARFYFNKPINWDEKTPDDLRLCPSQIVEALCESVAMVAADHPSPSAPSTTISEPLTAKAVLTSSESKPPMDDALPTEKSKPPINDALPTEKSKPPMDALPTEKPTTEHARLGHQPKRSDEPILTDKSLSGTTGRASESKYGGKTLESNGAGNGEMAAMAASKALKVPISPAETAEQTESRYRYFRARVSEFAAKAKKTIVQSAATPQSPPPHSTIPQSPPPHSAIPPLSPQPTSVASTP
jgi:hypothetical protein